MVSLSLQLICVNACMDGQNDDFINRMVLKFLAQSSGPLPPGIGLGLHPLDVFRRSMLTGKHHKIRSPQDIEDDNAIIRSAVELYEAGIQFKPSKTLSLHDIQCRWTTPPSTCSST